VQKQCVPLSGICTAPALCTEDSACPYGEICQQGQCAPGCVEDEACPNGQVCAQFRCVDMCAEANPCPVEQICDEGGHCKIEGGCLEPKDCIEPETYCDLSSNLCKAGCLEDFDCKSSGKICDNGTCVDKGCTANYFCSFGQVCNLGTGACEQAVGPYCEAGCEQGAETACEGKPNLCLGLQDKDGNDAGNFCFVACSPDPQNACPQGYSCEEFEHPEDGVVYPICARDCLVEPLGG